MGEVTCCVQCSRSGRESSCLHSLTPALRVAVRMCVNHEQCMGSLCHVVVEQEEEWRLGDVVVTDDVDLGGAVLARARLARCGRGRGQ